MKKELNLMILMGILFAHVTRANSSSIADSSKKITVYAYHNSILKYVYFIPKKEGLS